MPMTSLVSSSLLSFSLLLVFPFNGCGNSNSSGQAPAVLNTRGGFGGEAGTDGSEQQGGVSGGAGSSGGSNSSQCDSYAALWCARFKECAFFTFVGAYENETICRSVVGKECNDTVTEKRGLADATGCLASLSNAQCDDVLALLYLAYRGPVNGACRRLPGTRKPGDGCTSIPQCASSVCRFNGSPCGTCKQATLTQSEPCNVADNNCAPGLQCLNASSDPKSLRSCQAPVLGDKNADCDPLTAKQCMSNFLCLNGKCVSWAQENESCAASGNLCDSRRNLTCGSDNICHPFTIAQLGEGCSVDFPSNGKRCSEYAYCDSMSKKCVPRKKLNETCVPDPVAGSSCLPDLQCDSVSKRCVSFGCHF